MKRTISRIAAILMTVMISVIAGTAQNDAIAAAAGDKYVISAKAGGVNFVEGPVAVARKFGKSGLLLKGDKLEIGDRISTGADGKAEILLNPGSYLRLGGNSAFEFKTTSLDDLRLKLDRGSAILEVFAADDFRVTVLAPKARFSLIESGIYRIDVAKDGGGRIAVWRGKAQIGGSEPTVLKNGREAAVSGTQVAVAKFDRDDKDALDIWSKLRSKELARISSRLTRDNLRTSLISSFGSRGWDMYSSFGLWVFDPFRSSYCFLPFGRGWYSPYGYGFGHSIWYYNLPQVIYQQQPSMQSPTIATRKPGVPPFVQMQGATGPTGREPTFIKNTTDDSPMSTGPAYSPTKSEPPAIMTSKPRKP